MKNIKHNNPCCRICGCGAEQKIIKALEFYADQDNYHDQGFYWSVIDDDGRIAREALNENTS